MSFFEGIIDFMDFIDSKVVRKPPLIGIDMASVEINYAAGRDFISVKTDMEHIVFRKATFRSITDSVVEREEQGYNHARSQPCVVLATSGQVWTIFTYTTADAKTFIRLFNEAL